MTAIAAAVARINNGPELPCQLRIETAQIDVTTASGGHYEPDDAWTFVDAAGHFHAFTDDGKTSTLVGKEAPVEDDEDDGPADDDEDWYEPEPERWSECVVCGERVEPKWRFVSDGTAGLRRYVPGRTSYDLTVYGGGPVPQSGQFSIVVTVSSSSTMWFGFGRWAGERYESGGRSETEICVEQMWTRKATP
jgi:hypothetical protein